MYDVDSYFCINGTGKRNDCPFTPKGYLVVIFNKRNYVFFFALNRNSSGIQF